MIDLPALRSKHAFLESIRIYMNFFQLMSALVPSQTSYLITFL